jgi:hypothetical protein
MLLFLVIMIALVLVFMWADAAWACTQDKGSSRRTYGAREPVTAQLDDPPMQWGGVDDDKKISGHPKQTLQSVADAVEEYAVAAALPNAPEFEALSIDALPQKYWQPTFQGCAPVYTSVKGCSYAHPTPRLQVKDIDEVMFERSLERGRTNMVEPIGARQAMAQLLTMGVRSRKDVYTRASPSNDIGPQSICAQLREATPTHIVF